jgi:hypothetical protein
MTRMAATDPARALLGGLTGAKLAFGLYLAGYWLYLVPALIWGWSQGIEPFLGFALWQALLYAPLWPFVLFAQFYKLIIPLL